MGWWRRGRGARAHSAPPAAHLGQGRRPPRAGGHVGVDGGDGGARRRSRLARKSGRRCGRLHTLRPAPLFPRPAPPPARSPGRARSVADPSTRRVRCERRPAAEGAAGMRPARARPDRAPAATATPAPPWIAVKRWEGRRGSRAGGRRAAFIREARRPLVDLAPAASRSRHPLRPRPHAEGGEPTLERGRLKGRPTPGGDAMRREPTVEHPPSPPFRIPPTPPDPTTHPKMVTAVVSTTPGGAVLRNRAAAAAKSPAGRIVASGFGAKAAQVRGWGGWWGGGGGAVGGRARLARPTADARGGGVGARPTSLPSFPPALPPGRRRRRRQSGARRPGSHRYTHLVHRRVRGVRGVCRRRGVLLLRARVRVGAVPRPRLAVRRLHPGRGSARRLIGLLVRPVHRAAAARRGARRGGPRPRRRARPHPRPVLHRGPGHRFGDRVGGGRGRRAARRAVDGLPVRRRQRRGKARVGRGAQVGPHSLRRRPPARRRRGQRQSLQPEPRAGAHLQGRGAARGRRRRGLRRGPGRRQRFLHADAALAGRLARHGPGADAAKVCQRGRRG